MTQPSEDDIGRKLMKVFVINLDRDRVRLQHMLNEAQRIGLSFVRFAAVHGNHLEADLHPQFYTDGRLHEPAFTAGEIGVIGSVKLNASRDRSGPRSSIRSRLTSSSA